MFHSTLHDILQAIAVHSSSWSTVQSGSLHLIHGPSGPLQLVVVVVYLMSTLSPLQVEEIF